MFTVLIVLDVCSRPAMIHCSCCTFHFRLLRRWHLPVERPMVEMVSDKHSLRECLSQLMWLKFTLIKEAEKNCSNGWINSLEAHLVTI